VVEQYDVAVDFMEMTDDRRVWARRIHVRPGVTTDVGSYLVVGDEDADPRVARVVAIDPDRNLELEVLPDWDVSL
jgi:hypothetical protein